MGIMHVQGIAGIEASARVQGEEHALLSPLAVEKKHWMLTQEQVAEQEAAEAKLHMHVPPTPVKHKSSRVGVNYQALVPSIASWHKAPPQSFDERMGMPGPNEEEALLISAGLLGSLLLPKMP